VNVRQRQAAATRQQLLHAACEVFEEEGYTAASVGAITERASTAHGTFYLYFRNKEDAFCQVMEAIALEQVVSAVRTPPETPLGQRVEPVIRGVLQAYRDHSRLWRAVLQASLLSEKVRNLWMDLRRTAVSRVAEVLEAECARGACRPLDPTLTASALSAMTEGFAFVHFALQPPPGTDGATGDGEAVGGLDHAAEVLVDLWRHAVYGRLPV
jgi:AcrR family transcriptional regulator